MFKQVAKKLLTLLPILLMISLLSFGLMYLAPGNPAAIFLAQNGEVPDPIAVAKVEALLGLNKPFILQYLSWIGGILRGNFGYSIMTGNSVLNEMGRLMPHTIRLTLFALGTTLLVSIPIGILCARYEDSLFDRMIQMLSFTLSSFPGFLAALLLILILGVQFRILPTISTGSKQGIIIPMLALVLTISPTYIRQIRAAVLSELDEGYVFSQRARGISEHRIFFVDILKNIFPIILTLIGINLGYLLGGTAIIEIVCAYPGIGRMGIDAITNRDYPVVQAYTLLMALIFVGVNFIVELIQLRIDPRLRSSNIKHIENDVREVRHAS